MKETLREDIEVGDVFVTTRKDTSFAGIYLVTKKSRGYIGVYRLWTHHRLDMLLKHNTSREKSFLVLNG